jgi:FMN reductase
MSRHPRVVSVNGSPRFPSRTEVLVRAIGAAIADASGASWRHMPVTEIAPMVMPALTRDALDADGEAIIAEIEAADVIVIGTPVYRASFTGALKHVFDLVHYEALRGRIAVLAATGGNRHHGLVTEHQLRPLMSFFGMHTVPTTVYAEEADFDGYAIRSALIRERIANVAAEASRLLAADPAFSRVLQPAPIEEFVQ